MNVNGCETWKKSQECCSLSKHRETVKMSVRHVIGCTNPSGTDSHSTLAMLWATHAMGTGWGMTVLPRGVPRTRFLEPRQALFWQFNHYLRSTWLLHHSCWRQVSPSTADAAARGIPMPKDPPDKTGSALFQCTLQGSALIFEHFENEVEEIRWRIWRSAGKIKTKVETTPKNR